MILIKKIFTKNNFYSMIKIKKGDFYMKKFVILFTLVIQSSFLKNNSSSHSDPISSAVHIHQKECSCQESRVVKYLHAVERYLKDKKESIKNTSKKVAAKAIATTAQAVSTTYIFAIDVKEGISSGVSYVVDKVHNLIDWANDNQ